MPGEGTIYNHGTSLNLCSKLRPFFPATIDAHMLKDVDMSTVRVCMNFSEKNATIVDSSGKLSIPAIVLMAKDDATKEAKAAAPALGDEETAPVAPPPKRVRAAPIEPAAVPAPQEPQVAEGAHLPALPESSRGVHAQVVDIVDDDSHSEFGGDRNQQSSLPSSLPSAIITL